MTACPTGAKAINKGPNKANTQHDQVIFHHTVELDRQMARVMETPSPVHRLPDGIRSIAAENQGKIHSLRP